MNTCNWLCCLALTLSPAASASSAKSLLLDFGPAIAANSNATLSLAHALGAVPATEISWNTVQSDTDVLVYSDGSAATGVSIDLGRSAPGSPIVNFDDNGFISSALAGQITSGIYAGTSPMRDGFYGGSGGSNALAAGFRLNGLAPGTYTLYFAGRNTSTQNATPQRFFATHSPPATQFPFSTAACAWADETNSAPAVTAGFVPGDNCNYVVLNLTNGDSLFLASVGHGIYGVETLELRGFINAVEIVPGLPATNVSPALLGKPSAAITSNHLAMTYRCPKAATNFSFEVGVSSNLSQWASGAAYVDESIVDDDGAVVTHLARDKAALDARAAGFMRLKVTRRIEGSKVVFFGDSITAGYGVPADQNWVAQLTSRFNLNGINAGVGGNTSSQGLARMQNDVLASQPDFVLINFGMNDHVMTALDTPAVSQAVFRSNLVAMVDRARAIHAVPVLIAVNYVIEGNSSQYYYHRHPAGYYLNVGGAQAWLDSYIQILRDVAAEKAVDLADVRAACENYDRYDFLRSLLNAAHDDDGVHPYLTGSTAYQQVIGDYLAAHY